MVSSGIVPLDDIRPATFIGKGKVEEIAGLVKGEEAGIVVMDCALSPVQQRNLEKAWSAKVLDRTGLILEIFGRRAHTREGALQVELAHLTYQKSRLVRSWTHLERQRGGFGFLGGPGETQIETDRRLIEERIARIETELEKVKRTRKLHRDSRKRVPYPIVALVGYTNAGKSTLFNRLTRAQRAVRRHAVRHARSDFARGRPAARRADHPVRHCRLHLRSADHAGGRVPRHAGRGDRGRRHPARARRLARGRRSAAHDVEDVLRQLGIEAGEPRARVIEVWNKIDRLDAADARAADEPRGAPGADAAGAGLGAERRGASIA